MTAIRNNRATCQICGRKIGNQTGVIAHHGYQRPNRGSGWQTQSCFGARRQPYEIACDAIPPYIKMLENFVVSQNEAKTNLLTNSPAQFSIQQPFGKPPLILSRPEKFNANENIKRGAYSYRTYEGEHASRYSEHTRQADGATAEIKIMQTRLAEWKPTQLI